MRLDSFQKLIRRTMKREGPNSELEDLDIAADDMFDLHYPVRNWRTSDQSRELVCIALQRFWEEQSLGVESRKTEDKCSRRFCDP